MLTSLGFTDTKDKFIWDPKPQLNTDTEKINTSLSTEKNNELSEVDIIGQNESYTPTIWLGKLDVDGEEVVQEQIDEKEFVSDPYYMQNIDKEEFENERILIRFKDKDKSSKRGIKSFREALLDD
jgi:hypothetical protein